MATSGTLALDRDTLAVTGTSWMDHEFGSSSLMDSRAGWDWFAVQLDDGRELMLYALRRADGGIEPLSAGSLVERDGRVRHLALAAFRIAVLGHWTSPHTQAVYPSGWRLELPGEALSLEVTPRLRDQELVAHAMGGLAYWEGSCGVRGTSHGAPVTGSAYAELTGYAGR
jgi:predicted secreted hydrolase